MSESKVSKIAIPSSAVTVKLATTPDEFSMAMAIRAAVFLAEEDNITYEDEFDGNDMVATHLIAYVNGDPAGTFRIRWFAGFARLERLGIRKRYRCLTVLNALARAAMDLCRQKGYNTASGKAREEVVGFWRRFGGRPSGEAESMFRGTLVPMVYDIPAKPDLGAFSADLLGEHDFEDLVSQPEGAWDFAACASLRRPLIVHAAE
jgi:hypothetical protein